MKITYAPIAPNEAVQFTVHGFPEEEQIRMEIENFYKSQGGEVDRKFTVYNSFKEIIFTGSVNETGEIANFVEQERERKYPSHTEKPQ